MTVAGWSPFRLELLEPGVFQVDPADDAESQTGQDAKRYRTGVRRFVALLVDAIVMIVLGGIIFLVGLIGSSPGSNQPSMAILFITPPAGWLYNILLHGCYGQTVGKMVCGIKVLDISEQPINMRQALLRDSVRISIDAATLAISLYVFLEGSGFDSRTLFTRFVTASLGLVWMAAGLVTLLTNVKRRAIHDFIAGTVVVRV